ncbi:MAG: acetylglutamate kinase [Bacteroidetes bacterium]|nr:acetylglutamate kinase [Bacteroidota bacterium]MCH8523714.1 acetylglutamate kinase [Balneolales bacterium]
MGPVVVKISGSLTDQPEALEHIFSFVDDCIQHTRPVVIVHGGGKQINALSAKLGQQSVQVQGRRVTTPEALEVLRYTVGGSVNNNLVSALRKQGISAVGLNGTDGELTTALRREPLLMDGKPVDFQLVGEIDHVNPTLLHVLLNAGFIPVIGCLTWSANEGTLNINADTFSIAIASALNASEIVMLMEPEAVLGHTGEPIARMTSDLRDKGIQEGWINQGMIPKLHTGFQALASGIGAVRLTNPTGLKKHRGTLLIHS